MAPQPFELLYDYRCPFARIVHEHVLAAMDAGASFDVRFEPYTLSQGYVEPGDPDVWDDPSKNGDLLALEASLAVRDQFPDQFRALHQALFDARHVRGVALSTREQVADVLSTVGLEPAEVFALVDEGTPRSIIAERWRYYHDRLEVFGVPTFVIGDDAVFVRLMEGPDPEDPGASTALIEGLLRTMVDQPSLNEFKHTRLSR